MDPSTIAGIWPILYAFFDAAGQLDRSAMRLELDGCVAGGAHGVAVMGLATEVGKLDVRERRRLLEWVAEDLAGRKPLAVTVAEPSVAGQLEMARAAERLGAGWVILQPPPVAGLPEREYVRFLGAVADGVSLPVAVQNAPGYLGVALSNAGLRELARQHPNVCLLKGEGPAVGDPPADRGDGRRLPGPERARRPRAAGQHPRGLRGADPGAGVLRRPGADLRADADRAGPTTRRRPSGSTAGSCPSSSS